MSHKSYFQNLFKHSASYGLTLQPSCVGGARRIVEARFLTLPKESLKYNIGERVNIYELDASGILKVELCRPEKLNSLDIPMFEAIAKTIELLRDDKSIRAVVLCGSGRAFCAGLDIVSWFKHSQLKIR